MLRHYSFSVIFVRLHVGFKVRLGSMATMRLGEAHVSFILFVYYLLFAWILITECQHSHCQLEPL